MRFLRGSFPQNRPPRQVAEFARTYGIADIILGDFSYTSTSPDEDSGNWYPARADLFFYSDSIDFRAHFHNQWSL